MLYSQGRRTNGALCRLITLPGTGDVGFATAKKIGCIAARNRAKRRFREAWRTIGPALNGKLDCVVSIQVEGAVAPMPQIKQEIVNLTQKAIGQWGGESACS